LIILGILYPASLVPRVPFSQNYFMLKMLKPPRCSPCRNLASNLIKSQFYNQKFSVRLSFNPVYRTFSRHPYFRLIHRSSISLEHREIICGKILKRRIGHDTNPPFWKKINEYFIRNRKKITNISWSLKLIRLPVIIFGVFQLGKQQGVIDYVRSPQMYTDRLLNEIMHEFDAKEIVTEGKMHAQVERVGRQIIPAAQRFVSIKLKEARESGDEKDVEFWTGACKRTAGSWNYITLDSEIPNAFVTELFPRTIFVTTRYLEDYIGGDDDLALIFGHEVCNPA